MSVAAATTDDGAQLTCAACGYDLTGLSRDGRCPECGRPIRKPSSRSIKEDLTDAPKSYLRLLSVAFFVMFVGAGALIIGALGWLLAVEATDSYPHSGPAGMAYTALAGGLLVVATLFVVTEPRQSTKVRPGELKRERRTLRMVVRAVALLWVVGPGLLALGEVGAVTGQTEREGIVLVLGAAAWIVILLGLATLLVVTEHLTDFAHLGSHTSLANHINGAAWGVLFAGGGAFLIQLMLMLPLGVVALPLGLFVPLLQLGAFVCVLFLWVNLARLSMLCSGTISTINRLAARDERRRAQFERERENAEASMRDMPAPPPVTNRAPPRPGEVPVERVKTAGHEIPRSSGAQPYELDGPEPEEKPPYIQPERFRHIG